MTQQLELTPARADSVPPLQLFQVTIPGEPQRSKHLCTCPRRFPDTRPDPAWKAWRTYATNLIRALWLGREPIVVPVLVEVLAVFPRPKSRRRFYTVQGQELPYPWHWTAGRVPYIGTPDWDQVGKAGVDVCVRAGVLADDPLVVSARTPRFYAAKGEGPCVEVRLWSAL